MQVDDNWNKLYKCKAEQECADPKPSAWIQSEVNTIITSKFAKQGGKDIVKYIGARTYPGACDEWNASLDG